MTEWQKKLLIISTIMYVNNVNIYISYIYIVYKLFVEDCTDVKEILFRKKCKNMCL